MSTGRIQDRIASGPLATISGSVSNYVLRLLGLAVIDTFAVWLLYLLLRDGLWPLAAVLVVITVILNAIFLVDRLYPLRWMAPGLTLLVLMVLYPVLFTVYIAFTNYSDGNLLTKQQAVFVLSREQFLDEDAVTYRWRAYRSPEGEYALVLQSEEALFFARPEEPLQEVTPAEGIFGPADEDGFPQSIEGYRMLDRRATVRNISQIGDLKFGAPPDTIQVSSLRAAARYQQRYVYDEQQDVIIDEQTDIVYRGSEETGYFVNEEGERLRPGYQVIIGWDNFRRIYQSPLLRGPFLRVFIWTFAFAIVSVLTTFVLGLFLALVFDDPELPGRKLIRSLLIIPYTIPAVISVLIWRGMLNPRFGPVNDFLQQTIGLSPAWFSDPMLAKVGVLMVNLWLGYPYMMLISSGALQAIPSDVYEAAAVDGASLWQRFWHITLPLLLVSLGPLLITAFAFNLNNFNVIFLFNEGGPPISGTPTPAGHTDILISYTYRLAFGGGRGADYAFAAAITIIIFLLVATITFFQFRYTKMLEEVSENV